MDYQRPTLRGKPRGSWRKPPPKSKYLVVLEDDAQTRVPLGEAETIHACEVGHVVPLVVVAADGRIRPLTWKVKSREQAVPPYEAVLVVERSDDDLDLGGVRL